MTAKVAINGLGRIGRAVLKLVIDEPSMEIVAVNDLTDAENLAYLLRFDTVYGRYSKSVTIDGDDLVVAAAIADARLPRSVGSPLETVGRRTRVRVHWSIYTP
jgi:glyceraldehyde-3-phosphate dehydrogenase/erythrose-4-phosphate dehydrogenase